jgi:hypothetical protein
MTAANQGQQIGAQAAQGIGQLGAQDIAGASTLTGLQQSAPFASSANLAKVIGGLSVPTSETSSTQMSPLSQVGALTSALGGGTNAVNSLLNTVSPGMSISSLLSGLFATNPLSNTNMTGTGGMGDSGASLPTLPDGSANPNYDVYADPNATQNMIDAQNAASQVASPIAGSSFI